MIKDFYIIILSTILTIQISTTGWAAWQQDNRKWRYESDGTFAVNEFKDIDGYIEGYTGIGWLKANGHWYYFNSTGQLLTGEQVIDHKAYTFDDSGRMVLEGIHRDGLEDDLLSEALVKTYENWPDTIFSFDLINQERVKSGIAPLELDFNLSLIATYRCVHMNKYNYFSHVYSNEYPSDTNWKAYTGIDTELGEIIHCHGDINNPNNGIINTTTTREFVINAHNAYVNSKGHYDIMTASKYAKVGIGFFRNIYQTRDYNATLFSYYDSSFKPPSYLGIF